MNEKLTVARRTQGLNAKFKVNLENGKPKERNIAICGMVHGNGSKINVANSWKILLSGA